MTPDWLGAARQAAQALSAMLAERPTIAERVVETGERGEGGDRTLEIDAAAERAVFAELERLHDAGARFTAVSEERGTVDYGGNGTLVIIDPIDGSLNAKRGMHPPRALDRRRRGPDDGRCGVRLRLRPRRGRGVGGRARRGRGPRRRARWTRRSASGARATGARVIGIESADPRWVREAADELVEHGHRLRAIGTIAVTLCQVAAARLDGMATLRGCRAVDAAAGQLIVREAGGHVAFTSCGTPLGAPLDLVPRSPGGRRPHARGPARAAASRSRKGPAFLRL